MTPEGNRPKERVVVTAVSGGPDSVYLLLGKLAREKGTRIVIGHVNYGTRGAESVKDQKLVEKIGKTLRYETVILASNQGWIAGETDGDSGTREDFPPGFEKKAREIRYRFLRNLSERVGAEAIALAHTADDQVETILMRVIEGAGIGGLKGIPRASGDGIVRPILKVWKEDILDYLKKRKIPYRIDRSNVDTRFERNWIRCVLIPLLEERYGKAVKKRIFTLGERFLELDDYLESEAGRWIRGNVKMSPGRMRKEAVVKRTRIEGKSRHEARGQGNKRVLVFRRKTFSALPSVLRVKILQRICFDRLGISPNERLLKAMDGSVSGGGPSACVAAGKGWKLANRYEEALFAPEESGRGRKSAGSANGRLASPPVRMSTPGEYDLPLGRQGRSVSFAWEIRGKRTAAQAKRLAAQGDAEVFDEADLKVPLSVRPLRAGDRIRPFGGGVDRNARDGRKKVKEILIDRKVPRDDRWGRPVVCDAEGAILWIPGILRSSLAPVTPATRKTAILRIRSTK